MKNRKNETFVYKGLGFPIELIDVPMKKVFGEWIMDIDMNVFQLFIFNGLIRKPSSINGNELKFMRKFLELSPAELAKYLEISPTTLLRWEKGITKIPLTQEIRLRRFLLKELAKDKSLSLKLHKLESQPPKIDVKDMRIVA